MHAHCTYHTPTVLTTHPLYSPRIKAKAKAAGADKNRVLRVTLCACWVCLCCLECCLKFVMQVQ
jgi:hypothetical protein